jgi:hypothetical protein
VNLPVSGTLDDPSFRLGPVIWKALLGLLTKVVTAPFAALGALFGGGDELAYVDFAPGSAQVDASQTEKLSKLSKALVERPQLKLNVPLSVVSEDDGEALAHAALVARLPPDLSQPPTDEPAKRRQLKALEGLHKSLAGSAPKYPEETQTDQSGDVDARLAYVHRAVLDRLKPEGAVLETLARERARAIQDALLANQQLSPERVFMTSERKDPAAQDGHVRLEMKLE